MITFDARAWVVWLFAGALLAILIGNPLYLVLLLIISRLNSYACAPATARERQLPFWRISVMILVFSTLFNLLTAHVGHTVLVTLPAGWPLIGGPLTLEAAIYGFLSGLRLVTMLSFFLAFNTIVPVSELTGLTPRALHELGLVVLIALTYVPETIHQYRRIRNAQAIRGHRVEGLRDWRPILIPLLIAGLERALNLAETMVARGYGSTTQTAMSGRARGLLLLALLLALAGALRLIAAESDGPLWLGVAALAVGLAYHDLSRSVPHTRYRPRRWAWDDTLLVAGALIALLPLLPALSERGTLAFQPYPQARPPLFDPLIGLCLLGLAAPAARVALAPGPEVRS
jgi:energy-coupling factor transport system permease protein